MGIEGAQSIEGTLEAGMRHRAAGRIDEAIALVRDALQKRPEAGQLHHLLGTLLVERGALDAAAHAFRAALRLQGDLAESAFQLGNVMWMQGRLEEAVAAYRRAIAAHPRMAPAHNNLALVLEALGRWEEALDAHGSALLHADLPEIRANVARCLVTMPRVTANEATRALVARALAQAWIRPADLARVAIGLLRLHPVIGPAIERAQGAPAPLSRLLPPEAMAACVREPLFAALLENAHASDAHFERFLTAARRALLEARSGCDARGDDIAVAFTSMLGRQCFLNDYLLATSPEEEESGASLARGIADALSAAAKPAPAVVALAACYRPLHRVEGAAALAAREWPAPVRALLVQQVEEPAAETGLRVALPTLSPIDEGVSSRVREQYEENPYPRWTRLPAARPMPLDTYLRTLFPQAALPARGTIADRDILIAGCGTGQESLDLARQYPESRILAIDLSRASLAYAARKTREAGCTSVEYAQADITTLRSLERNFDFISCVGVLHHLADPMTGWRALAARLRPGGFMQVGLYSEIARAEIQRARAEIAARRVPPLAADMRRFRAELLADPAWDAVTRLRDFYGMNECRDLLFHVQEHSTTLDRLRLDLDALGLRFIGMAVAPPIARAFAARFPSPTASSDLASWDAFERANPEAFAGMYIFWVQKPARA